MWLEDSRDLAILIQLADAAGALEDFLRMVGIVGDQYVAVVLQVEVEAAIHTVEGAHAVFQFIGCATSELSHCHRCYTVFDIDGNGMSQLHVLHILDGRDEVELYFAISNADVLSMEVALVEAIVVGAYTLLHIGLHGQSTVDDKGAARLDERGIMTEALQIGFGSAVDIQMVGVGRSDDCHPRTQPVERAVELVGFNHHIVALSRQQIVRTVVFRDAAQEGIALHVALMQDVGAHARRRRLSMRTSHAESFMLLRENAQYLSSLHHLEALFAEPYQLLMVGGYGGGIDDEARLRLPAGLGNAFNAFLVVNQHAFFL